MISVQIKEQQPRLGSFRLQVNIDKFEKNDTSRERLTLKSSIASFLHSFAFR